MHYQNVFGCFGGPLDALSECLPFIITRMMHAYDHQVVYGIIHFLKTFKLKHTQAGLMMEENPSIFIMKQLFFTFPRLLTQSLIGRKSYIIPFDVCWKRIQGCINRLDFEVLVLCKRYKTSCWNLVLTIRLPLARICLCSDLTTILPWIFSVSTFQQDQCKTNLK